jgi:HlyD family secretion protein
MKKRTSIVLVLTAAIVLAGIIFVSWQLRRNEPVYLQGTVECKTYKASSKVAGRIARMVAVEGKSVRKGDLLYTLATPELDAKLQQAEAVQSAAEALSRQAATGAREQQKQAALGLWQQAQAGLALAQKTHERVQNLYDQGVVPAQKLDEATAGLASMQATERAARAQYDLAIEGARTEEKTAAAAQVQQAEGAVSEVEAYLSDATIYSPVEGEVSTIIAEEGELVGSGYPVISILDLSDGWVTFNIREDLMPGITMGGALHGYVPALDRDVELQITYIAPQADFATWSATRTQGGFDVRTFVVRAKPVSEVENIRPGMSVLVKIEN